VTPLETAPVLSRGSSVAESPFRNEHQALEVAPLKLGVSRLYGVPPAQCCFLGKD